MSNMMRVFTVLLMMVFAGAVSAAVTIDVATSQNVDGDTVYVLTAVSDGALISSLGIDIAACPGGCLGQVKPFGLSTHLQDHNEVITFTGKTVDQDSQVLFHTASDGLIVVPGSIDTDQRLQVNVTGFQPFMSREIVQVVAVDGTWIEGSIGVVADGELYTQVLWCPEPASLGLLGMGMLAVMRRR